MKTTTYSERRNTLMELILGCKESLKAERAKDKPALFVIDALNDAIKMGEATLSQGSL